MPFKQYYGEKKKNLNCHDMWKSLNYPPNNLRHKSHIYYVFKRFCSCPFYAENSIERADIKLRFRQNILLIRFANLQYNKEGSENRVFYLKISNSVDEFGQI